MQTKINETIKTLNDMKTLFSFLNKQISSLELDDSEDAFLLNTFKKMPSYEDIDSMIFYLREKELSIQKNKLYYLETDEKAQDGIKITEVKILKETDKQFQVNELGYNRISKFTDLNVNKGNGTHVRVFTTDLQEGIQVVKKALEQGMEDIRERLEQHNNILAKIKLSNLD